MPHFLRPFLCALLAAACAGAAPRATGFQSDPAGTHSDVTGGNFSERQEPREQPTAGPHPGRYQQHRGPAGSDGSSGSGGSSSGSRQKQAGSSSEDSSALLLKVQVNDLLSRRRLGQASVEVFVNHSRTQAVLTGEEGGVSLRVPLPAGPSVTVVASKDGYVSTQLPCVTDRSPVFSSLTLSLLPQNRGNIWFFNDSVLISATESGSSRRSVVQFPRRLLGQTGDINLTSVEAYLTFPKLQSEDGSLKMWGIMATRSGYLSVALTPVAAVSVQLFSGGAELFVGGPVRINLSLPAGCRRWRSSVVPAWYLNRTTGGWMRKGLGRVESVDGRLVWTFTAPHLGYWMAAPLTPPSGFFSLDAPFDFLLHHWFFLLLLLGGLLTLILSLLLATVCYGRKSLTEAKTLRAATTKDKSTSTGQDGVSSGGPDDVNQWLQSRRGSCSPAADVIANPNIVSTDLELNTELNDLTAAERVRVTSSLMENLFFCNQPVAVLHAPAIFQLEEGSSGSSGSEEPPRSRSATLPRSSAPNAAAAAAAAPQLQSQDGHAHTGPGLDLPADSAPSSSSASRAAFSLQESLSVPGTLNRLLGSRQTPPPLQPPRAWFVSLEGKPAAEVRYADAAAPEQQRRRRAAESRDTSLDSGVDMSELGHTAGRKVALERNATFVKSTKQAGGHRDSGPDL